MKKLMNWLAAEESGQGMVEYALILALVSIVAIAALALLGPAIREKFDAVNTQLGVTTPTETPQQ